MLIFKVGGKLENPEKDPRSKGENQQQTQPTYSCMTPGPGIEPGTHWWEASALLPPLLVCVCVCQCLHVYTVNRSHGWLDFTVLFRLHVCCLGAGPGSEILGLHQLLPSCTEWLLLDNCEQWAHTAQILLQDVSDVPFRYGAFDICNNQGRGRRGTLTPNYAFKKVSSDFYQPKLTCTCKTVNHAS